MPGRRAVPFPEFARWKWGGDRDKPKTDPDKTSIKHDLPEAVPPPDFGISYEQYRNDVAKWSAEKLSGHLNCLEDNIRENTMPVAMARVMREAQVERRDEIAAYKLEYSRRNKSYLWEDSNWMNEKRKQEEEEGDTVVEFLDTGKGGKQRHVVKREHIEEGLQNSDDSEEGTKKKAKTMYDATLAQRAQ